MVNGFQPVVRVPLVVRKGFLGGTRVTSIILIKKPRFTAFWYLLNRVFLLNKSIFWKLAILIVSYYCNLHVRKATKNYTLQTKLWLLQKAKYYLENVIITLVKFLINPASCASEWAWSAYVKYGFISVDRYGEILPQCAGCVKTLFKPTMKPRRRLEYHVEQTTLIKRTKIRANSSGCAGTPSSKAWTTC